MFYDNKNQIIISELPKNSIGPDGNFYFDFDTANDINLWATHGYFTVRNDQPEQPCDKATEKTTDRVVSIDFPYVDITRVWHTINCD
jgi:hypothetical protein